MGTCQRQATIVVAAAVMTMAVTVSVRVAKGQTQVRTPVQTVDGSGAMATRPGQNGATYYWLESQTTRLITRFADVTAVAERGAYGRLTTRLTDASGNELGRLDVTRPDGLHDVVRYVHPSGATIQAAGDPSVRPTLHWTNLQLYQLWRDNVDSAATRLEWQNGLMRARGTAPRDAERDVRELTAEWSSGLTARSVRKTVVRHQALPGRIVDGDAVATQLTDASGNEIGVAYWYARPQLFVWSIPALHTSGFIGPEHLKGEFGGWPFTPDMAWMNLQVLAFHHYKSQINTQRFVARAQGLRWSLLQFFAPTLSANEAGCDDLHWLDGSTFRYCCDVHDLCYSRAGCTSKSWWLIFTSWTCDYCNMDVVRCFATGGIGSGGPGKLG
ncbi:MAG: hypothetical protein ACREYB_13300 [Casimicrobiaceae bacterium]